MKLKSFLSIITICQFSGCGVYEAQVNDSIEVHNQGIENRVTSLENKIDALKQEINQIDIKNNQLEKNVRFINQVKSDELLKYFRQTHYFYLSLKNNKIFSKTVPAKLQTYLAVGKPIIASISGEANSILKKHKTGFQAKAERAEELSLIFNNLKNINKDKYEYYCSNCRKLYEKEFSSLNRKEQLNDLINKL